MANKVEQLVADLATPLAQELGLDLVEVNFKKVGNQWHLEVIIEKPAAEGTKPLGGVSIDDCQRLSQALSKSLDELDPIAQPYILEVASPGLERKLKPSEFSRFTGHLVAISTYQPIAGKKQWEGRLLAQVGEEIVISVRKQEVRIPLKSIAKAHLIAEI